MTAHVDKATDLPAPPAASPDAPSDGPAATRIPSRGTRAELEAQQKRYMDDRFGRDRPMSRKPRG
jgi:hypothetical protein